MENIENIRIDFLRNDDYEDLKDRRKDIYNLQGLTEDPGTAT
jgi:hypothetical protein